MRFASLGSGSRGNGTLVQIGSTVVLVDCGFSLRITEARLARLGCAAADLSAVLVTHEHADHVSGVGALVRRYRLPVWLTAGTLKAAQTTLGELPDANLFSAHAGFSIGALQIDPIAVPHDAREPAQFVLGDGNHRLGLLTDTGNITPHIRRCLDALDALLLEFNHDEQMLAAGPYPAVLKRRVGGQLGHLSNRQSADLLRSIDTTRLQHLVAMHLSAQNNTTVRARECAAEAMDCTEEWVAIADQDAGLDWRDLS
jgi:phosphoribosyl 1,2-cyclic phosphodiesterase